MRAIFEFRACVLPKRAFHLPASSSLQNYPLEVQRQFDSFPCWALRQAASHLLVLGSETSCSASREHFLRGCSKIPDRSIALVSYGFRVLQDVIGQFSCLNRDVGGRQCHSVLRLRGYRWYAVWMWPSLRLLGYSLDSSFHVVQ